VISREFQDRLHCQLHRAGVVASTDLATKLEVYYRLLATWNRKINLTGLNLTEAVPEAIDRLLVEPLVAARHVRPESRVMIDVGSGGGSPAIPFALSAGLKLLMVESKGRKAVFLREAMRAVDIIDGDVATARFEELLGRPDLHEAHDLLTVRALRIEPHLLLTLQGFVKPGGELYLFRGPANSSETITPPLISMATFPLVDSLGSRLIVLGKR